MAVTLARPYANNLASAAAQHLTTIFSYGLDALLRLLMHNQQCQSTEGNRISYLGNRI